jgi:ParB family transcriptional regulator, chromosome partitioning protein
MADSTTSLREVPPDYISPNPDNPRLIFRESEMNQLLDSISEVGIKVPLSVFGKGRSYILLDGERRWRCARKLNLSAVPVLVQPKPTRLENLLTMFNIHNVRTDWDLMPMALKLADVQAMLEEEGQPTRPKDLSGLTGVPLPTVRRALELLDLPKRYQDLLLKEAEKPKEQQEITADVFVEVNKSKRVLKRYVPEVFEDVSETAYVDAMVDKYRDGVVKNVVRYRDVSKIGRVERTGGDPQKVVPTLVRLVKDKKYTIEDAYEGTVQTAYTVRDASSRTESLRELLEAMRPSRLPKSLRKELIKLREEINRLLGDD